MSDSERPASSARQVSSRIGSASSARVASAKITSNSRPASSKSIKNENLAEPVDPNLVAEIIEVEISFKY